MDTGATTTCISGHVVNNVGLMPVGKAQMISASHLVNVNTYSFIVGITTALQQQPTGLFSAGFMMFEGITGAEFNPGGAQYEVLIGMDIIRRGSLKIDFDGHFSFCV